MQKKSERIIDASEPLLWLSCDWAEALINLSATARRVTSKLDEVHKESGTLPDNARRVCFTLFSKLGTNTPWPEIHKAFYDVLNLTTLRTRDTHSHRKEESNESTSSGVIEFLQKDWKVPYYPDSLEAL
jgi:hypothetical protein